MPSYRPLSPAARRRSATVAGVIGAVFALLMTTATTAAAAPTPAAPTPPGPGEAIQPGDAWMGSGLRSEVPKGQRRAPSLRDTSGVQGIDVSHWQGAINWNAVKSSGIDFAWIKATGGTSYKDSRFDSNYPAAHAAGVVRGAYHFARPNYSSGATQANFFASNGGAWSADNLTLPGVLDIEHNPSGAMCYGLSTTQMRNWINDFYATYKARTSRDVVIYTTASWWNRCTGSWSGMSAKSPLWVAHWTNGSPTIPNGFPTWTVWQYTSTGSVSGVSGNVDRNKFNGSMARLRALANNTP